MPRYLYSALLLFSVTFPALAQKDDKPGLAVLHLADGKFGKALDPRLSPVQVEGNDRWRNPPLTVECWARCDKKSGFNVLVASDRKSSARHWELYSYAGTGNLSAYLPGYEPSEVVSKTNICDGKWHYIAMTFDGKTVRLYFEGVRVHEQEVKKRASSKAEDGPLTIGMALTDSHRIGCDGLIDDVRVSSVVRKIDGPPKGPLPLDQETVGLWRFDRADAADADPAWTPRPQPGDAAPWEKETDKDWIDERFRAMDTGPFLDATFAFPPQPGRVFKGTAIRVGDKGEAGVVFDRNQLRLAAGWTGGFLEHSSRRFGLLNTPTPAGKLRFLLSGKPGWGHPAGGEHKTPPATAPLPAEWGKYNGLYLHGKRVVLSYRVGSTEILESPWVETAEGTTALSRTVEVGAGKPLLVLRVAEVTGDTKPLNLAGVELLVGVSGKSAQAVALLGPTRDWNLAFEDGGLVKLVMPVRREKKKFKVFYWQGDVEDLPKFAALVKNSDSPADLSAWTKPGPARWTTPITTRGEVGKDDGPFAVDTLTVPYDNPHKALFYISGIDFLPDGTIAVCTAHGDVWLVKGADAKLEKLTWKRFATGLYQPLGLKVVGGVIHVLERGQLTRLYDRNDDGEADHYECLCGDWHTGGGEHSFDTCLETDPEGNFYFFKTGDTDTPTGGCLMRVSKDGAKAEVFATGFRHPIGLGASPTGLITGGDQEGNWMPSTRIDVYKKGGFYGDMRSHHRTTPPPTYDPPLCWLPRQVDNSAGGQVWVPEGKFGPLEGQCLHLSYGRCRLLLLLRQEVEGVWQGGGIDLGLQFLSGVARGRFHPRDGHLYVVGLDGWQTAAVRDGCLQRVRWTGKKLAVPVGLSVHADGIKLTFSEKLDAKSVDAGRFRVEQWNYRWSGDYGSRRWSVAHPEREGQDVVPVKSARLLDDGRGVFLEMPDVKAVMQMQIRYELTTASGEPVKGVIHNTIHRKEKPLRQ